MIVRWHLYCRQQRMRMITETSSSHGLKCLEQSGAIIAYALNTTKTSTDRIGDEIEVNTEHSELEDDITLDLNSSFVNTSTVSDGVSRIPGRRSIGGKR